MTDKVYTKAEVVGCSGESIEKAVQIAVAQANKQLPGCSWFEISEVRGAIRDGKPSEWQVTVKVGGKLG